MPQAEAGPVQKAGQGLRCEGWRGLRRLPWHTELTGMDGRPAAHSARR